MGGVEGGKEGGGAGVEADTSTEILFRVSLGRTGNSGSTDKNIFDNIVCNCSCNFSVITRPFEKQHFIFFHLYIF